MPGYRWEGQGRGQWEGQGRGQWEGQVGVGGAGGTGREGTECQVPAPLSPFPPSCSGDGSATSGASEEVKSPAAMAQAVKVHQDTSRVMYFA